MAKAQKELEIKKLEEEKKQAALKAEEEKKKAEEGEILQQEADDALAQWVDQATNLSKIAMPLGRRITIVVVTFVSVALAVGSFWSSAAADAPVPLLQ